MKRSLGRKYSPVWEGSGFNQSLEVPRSLAGLDYVMRSLKNFLTDHPAN